MQPLQTLSGIVAPLVRDNIDTDQIIPKQFLTTVTRDGLGDYLFDAWRFEDEGHLGKTLASRHKRTDFILNQQPFNKASILLCGANFGCGSSREHAAWSLMDFGIRAIIAENFADIFFSNAVTNGLLPIRLNEQNITNIAQLVQKNPEQTCHIDLPAQTIAIGNIEIRFDIDAASKHKIVCGLDAIGITLLHSETIKDFEQKHLATYPWL